MKTRQIFAIGGKFIVDLWQAPVLQKHLLSLADMPEPRVCYIGTATGENPRDTEVFYRSMNRHGCRVSHLNLFEPHTEDFEDYLLGHDIIYVAGGSTRNMLTIWRDWGLDTALETAWREGVVLSGTSAGAICWFEACITDSLPSELRPLDCLGFLPGSACTHYDARPDRPTTFRALIGDGTLPGPGLATDDFTALHYVGTELREVVSAKKGARAYLIERDGAGHRETPLPARLIGE